MSQLWSNYYSVKKPCCLNCEQQQITENEYNFCSLEKKPVTVYDERGIRVIHTFNNIYACNVYHWTLYQGQGKIERSSDNKPLVDNANSEANQH